MLQIKADFFETLNSQRAVREFKPEPIEDEKIKIILDMAVKAPSGGNSQTWEFIIVKKAEAKNKIKTPIAESWHKLMNSPFGKNLPPEKKAIYDKATELVDNTGKVPVFILACVDTKKASSTPEVMFASIYPAVQNILLTAQALGLGACLTTHASTGTNAEADVKRVLNIPERVKICAMIFLGYAARKYGPPKRISVDRFTHYDKW